MVEYVYVKWFDIIQGLSSSLASSLKQCCLCCCDLATSKGKNHRKRLGACEKELKKLEECLGEFCNRDISNFDEFNEDSILCYGCIQTLSKLAQADKEVLHFKQILFNHLQRYMGDDISRKRP